MAIYSKGFKEKLFARTYHQTTNPYLKFQREKISVAILHELKNNFSDLSQPTRIRKQSRDKWSSQDKFLILMVAAGMNEIELSNYCRSKVIIRGFFFGIILKLSY